MQERILPLGIHDFEKLRRGNYLYVDKTDMAWAVTNNRRYNNLSRPRRFGKSLFASTLKCYFEGRKELFNDISEEKQLAAGRTDLVAKPDSIIYIMELKMNDEGGAKSVTQQIATRHYADSYATSDKRVICLAL